MAGKMSKRSRFGLSGSAAPGRRRRRSEPALGRLARLRSLRLEPLEERTLLSADLTYMHIIYDPADNGAGASSSGVNASRWALRRRSGTRPRRFAAPTGSTRSTLAPSKGAAPARRFPSSTPTTIRTWSAARIRTSSTATCTCSTRRSASPIPPVSSRWTSTAARTIPASDTTGWSVEEALDVEWAHAIAPQANIILIEAASTSDADLITTALGSLATSPTLSNVSVVSMSFGRSETSSDTSENSSFTTPAGHTGVTFLASTGDDGAPGCFPAYSPNVVAVGGTTLTLSGDTYVSETGWSWNASQGWGTGGGQSSYESEPSYQTGVQSSGWRQIPDVSFDADPTTGVAMYDSYEEGRPGSRWAAPASPRPAGPAWLPSATNCAPPSAYRRWTGRRRPCRCSTR